MEWIVQLPVLLFSVVVHEVSHGWAAFLLGDRTASRAGRLSLSPFPHLDPFGSLFVPALCFLSGAPMFGWAKPVPVRPSRLRRPARDAAWVALAGPASNMLLALCAGALYAAAASFGELAPDFKATTLDMLRFAVVVNLFLAFFNLLPVHPLDGGKVLSGLLPGGLRKAYERHAPYGTIIVLVLLFTRGTSEVVLWPARAALSLLTGNGWAG